MSKGLYDKYEVYKDGEPIENCFVLEPETDSAARVALRAYSIATDNSKLTDDLIHWLKDIHSNHE